MLFGFSEEQVAHFGMTVGLGCFIAYMLFVIGNLAWQSKAGKEGALVLFLVLALGMVGFAAKSVLQSVLS
jgi:hypothetical protein